MVVATAQLHLDRPQNLWLMPFLVVLHHGMCLNNTIAVLHAFTSRKGVFERTPKFGSLQNFSSTPYFKQLTLNFPWAEIVAVICLVGSLSIGLVLPDLQVGRATYPWLAFFALSFVCMLGLHLQELCAKVIEK